MLRIILAWSLQPALGYLDFHGHNYLGVPLADVLRIPGPIVSTLNISSLELAATMKQG